MTPPPFLVPWLCQGMPSWRLCLQYHKREAEPLTMHSQVEPGNERNVHICQGLQIVHIRLGLKSQAHSLSPLKWTLIVLCIPLERTLAISPEIDFRTGGICGLQKMEQDVR